eukprot:g59163.t1
MSQRSPARCALATTQAVTTGCVQCSIQHERTRQFREPQASSVDSNDPFSKCSVTDARCWILRQVSCAGLTKLYAAGEKRSRKNLSGRS